MCALGLRAPSFANGTLLFRCSKCEHLVLAKNIAHDMKSGADGAHFFGALLLTFSFDKHTDAGAFVHTATAWRILENYTRIPVEHIMIERIKQNKSLVDIKLTARACQEHYQKQVDSFVIVSSDSDYWGLISSLPDARFLVMIEREKCGPDMKAALAESGIFYCYLDDFYSGNSEDIKKNALFKEMYRWIDNSVHLNVNDMFDAALRNTRIEMSPAERRQFYEKHIRHMTLTIDENGNVSIELKRG